MENNMAYDGNKSYGFPLTFFQVIGGKRYPPLKDPVTIDYVFLIVDYLVALVLAFGIFMGIKKIAKRNK